MSINVRISSFLRVLSVFCNLYDFYTVISLEIPYSPAINLKYKVKTNFVSNSPRTIRFPLKENFPGDSADK